MAMPVVIVSSGGLPVVPVTTGYGLPVEVAANGYGLPVTQVTNGYGLPVVFSVPQINPGNQPDRTFDWTTDQAYSPTGALPGTASSLLTVTRAGTAYIDDTAGNWTAVAANTARISNKGLLIETARTNLFLQSATPATQSITVVNASVYTVSVIGTGTLTLSGAGTGTVSQGAPVTFTAGSTSLTVTTAGITGTFVNAQVELGTWASSPIRTTTVAVTRAADVVNMTGLTFGSAYSMFAKVVPMSPATNTATQFIMCLNPLGSGANRFHMYRNATTGLPIGASTSGGVAQPIVGAGPLLTTGIANKVAAALAISDLALCVNGGAPGINTAVGVMPVGINSLSLGHNSGGGTNLDGYIQQSAYWTSQRVPNAQLQSMTA